MASTKSNALVSTLEFEIGRAKDDLKEVDDNIKRLTGRNFAEPPPQRAERQVKMNFNGRDDEPPPKRKPPGGVFARLGAPVLEASRNESRSRRVEISGEDIEPMKHKPMLSSSVTRPIGDSRSRTEVAAELTKDRASRDRNRRMFGALLGTLQRFRSDEAKQKDKEDKRTAIEKKLEEKGRVEQEEMRKKRMDLFKKRDEQQARIRGLHMKMSRIKQHEDWEAHQRRLGKFIRTKTTPKIFWSPKIINYRSTQLVSATKGAIEDELELEREKLKVELEDLLGGSLYHHERDQEQYSHSEEEAEEGELPVRRPSKRMPSHSPSTEHRSTKIDYDNGELLDYEAEEGELVYEDAQVLSGKVKQKPERVVVQVKQEEELGNRGGSHRRVELVSVVRGGMKRKIGDSLDQSQPDESDSEKENLRKLKISGVKESISYMQSEKLKNDKTLGKDKKDKKQRKKEKEKHKEKRKDEKKKKAEEKEIPKVSDSDSKLDYSEEEGPKNETKEKEAFKSSRKEVQTSKGEGKRAPKSDAKSSSKENSKPSKDSPAMKGTQQAIQTEDSNKKAEPEEIWSEDLSHISLPLEPQHVLEGPTEDSESSLMQQTAAVEGNINDKSAQNDKEKKDLPELPNPSKSQKHVELLVLEKQPDITNKDVTETEIRKQASRSTPPKSPVEERLHSNKKGEERHHSADSGESSSESESSISSASSGSSSLSESGSSSSSTLSSSESESEDDSAKQQMRMKRRRPANRHSSSHSSTDSSSDIEGERKRQMKLKPPKRQRKSIQATTSSKSKNERNDIDKSQEYKSRGKADGKSADGKRERERNEDVRNERERGRESMKSREKGRELKDRERGHVERSKREDKSRERKGRSRSREKRKERK